LIINLSTSLTQQDIALHIGNSLAPITLTNPQPLRSPCSTTKPSSGTTSSHHTGWKSSCRSKPDTESDFYLDFTCQKPKLKWNLTKFDYRQTQAENSLQLTYTSSSTAMNESSCISGTTALGPQTSLPHTQVLSTPLPILPSPSPSQIPREETPNTWNVSSISSWNQIFSHSIHPITTAWTVLYPPLWLVPLNPVPQAHLSWYISMPKRSPFQTTTRIFVSAESTFVVVIAITLEPHLPHLESTSGTPDSSEQDLQKASTTTNNLASPHNRRNHSAPAQERGHFIPSNERGRHRLRQTQNFVK